MLKIFKLFIYFVIFTYIFVYTPIGANTLKKSIFFLKQLSHGIFFIRTKSSSFNQLFFLHLKLVRLWVSRVFLLCEEKFLIRFGFNLPRKTFFFILFYLSCLTIVGNSLFIETFIGSFFDGFVLVFTYIKNIILWFVFAFVYVFCVACMCLYHFDSYFDMWLIGFFKCLFYCYTLFKAIILVSYLKLVSFLLQIITEFFQFVIGSVEVVVLLFSLVGRFIEAIPYIVYYIVVSFISMLIGDIKDLISAIQWVCSIPSLLSLLPCFSLILSISTLIVTIIPLLGSVAIFTLAERKVMATIHRRRGPNVVGVWGLLQPLADGLKLVIKETVVPNRASTGPFLIAPALSFVLSICGWCLIPLHASKIVNPWFFSDPNLGVLFLFAVSSLGAYGVLIGGWASNSKYALLGSLRSAAQMISYEVSLGLTVLSVVLCAGSLNLGDIVQKQSQIWYVFPLSPLMVIFLVSMLAETNRAPFDLPEAEAELVAGFNVEYSGIVFALFFLAEYSSMLLMGVLLVMLFFGGWLGPFYFFPASFIFFAKSVFFFFIYIFVRSNFPRLRYDQLMNICWKVFLPLTLAYLIFVSGILMSFNGLPLDSVPSIKR